MAVYRQGYTRYQGALTGRVARLLVLPKFATQQVLGTRLITSVLVVAMFWPVACAGFVYVANRADLLVGLGAQLPDFLVVDSDFFFVFMNVQSTFAIILAALAGPSLVAPDLANGALPLYLSRPLSRTEYVVARMLALVGLLSAVTWVPGMLLFLMQSNMAGWGWFAANWSFGAAVFFGFLLWILLVGLVALAASAYVKWRIVAGALVLAVFFVLAGAAELTNAVLRVGWASAFNPGRAMSQIWLWMLGADPIPGPTALQCLIAMAVMAALLLLVLERRLRPVQVVS
jgi:ABC-2 type transport system permease protein